MLLTMGIGLYSSRIVLSILGVEDFGIYNVVGGIVVMFGFLNIAMAGGTQRFLTYELGKNNHKELNRIFSMSLNIHILTAIIILILSETIGLWFLIEKLNIPAIRMNAALWVYQFSILSFIISIIQVPYNASIIAHEQMNMYAYISIFEAVLKLLILFALVNIGFDKLILYAVLIFCIALIVSAIYIFYCKNKFIECRYYYFKDKNLFKTLTSFSGWNLFGGISVVIYNQGLNILLNLFFGPIINAARGIAYQINTALNLFSSNFQLAIKPQITKSYANEDKNFMINLIYSSSKYSFFLLFFIALPVMLETNTILHVWLKTVPDYTVTFCRLVIIDSLIGCMSTPLMTAVQATGKIKKYQLIIGGMITMNLPLSWIALKLYPNPEYVFYISITISIIALFVRIFLLQKLINISIPIFSRIVLLPVIKVVILSSLLSLFIYISLQDVAIRLYVVTFSSFIITIIFVFIFGLKNNEKITILYQIKKYIS